MDSKRWPVGRVVAPNRVRSPSPKSPRALARRRTTTAKLPRSPYRPLPPWPVVLVAAAYGVLILLAILAVAHKREPAGSATVTPAASPPLPSLDPYRNSVAGDFVGVWNGSCRVHVTLAATSKVDNSDASGSIALVLERTDRCQGQATGRVTCLWVRENRAFLSWWLADNTGDFGPQGAAAMEASLIENDPQRYGPPVDRAAFGFASRPECPPPYLGAGPMIISGTIQIAQAQPPIWPDRGQDN